MATETQLHPRPRSRAELVALLAECEGRINVVAERTGRDRRQVYRWMKQFDVEPGTGRAEDDPGEA